jgi:heme/copper-type cytochrome/quinol oxidase subunit 2
MLVSRRDISEATSTQEIEVIAKQWAWLFRYAGGVISSLKIEHTFVLAIFLSAVIISSFLI